MGNEIVKYDNDFNNQALRKFTSEELNLLMTIFHKLRDQSINILEYSFYDLKRLINLEKNMTNFYLKFEFESLFFDQTCHKKKVLKKANIEDALLNLAGMNRHIAFKLAEKQITTLEELAEQGVDDLTDIEELSAEQAADLIMAARNICWFGEE